MRPSRVKTDDVYHASSRASQSDTDPREVRETELQNARGSERSVVTPSESAAFGSVS